MLVYLEYKSSKSYPGIFSFTFFFNFKTVLKMWLTIVFAFAMFVRSMAYYVRLFIVMNFVI